MEKDWQPIMKKNARNEEKSGLGKTTNIRLHEDTKKAFDALGEYGDSADTILKRLIAFYNSYKTSEKDKK